MAMPHILVKKPGALERDSSWVWILVVWHWVNNITSRCISSYKRVGKGILQADLVKRGKRI